MADLRYPERAFCIPKRSPAAIIDSRTEDEVELGWKNDSNEVAIIFSTPQASIPNDSAVNDSAKNSHCLVSVGMKIDCEREG